MEPWTLVAVVFVVALASMPAEEHGTEKENIVCIASTCNVHNSQAVKKPEESEE